MKLLQAFRGLRPVPERVADVIAPPYDVLSSDEARELAKDKPWSFLHVSKPEIDLPPETNPYDASVYAMGASNFNKMKEQGMLIRDEQPCYYIYELTMDGHVQTGIAAAASIQAYDEDIIRKHEHTRPKKEDDRVNQIKALRAQTGPVFLTYRQQNDIDEMVNQVKLTRPVYDLVTDDGIRHRFWIVDDAGQVDWLDKSFSRMERMYIADGHHRSAAASRVCADKKSDGGTSCDSFLAVLFPDDQVQIFDYNRIIRDLNDLSADDFLDKIGRSFSVEESSEPVRPAAKGEYGMYMPGQWYKLTINPEFMASGDSVHQLDVSMLHHNLIGPVLDITDPRRDDRIDF
ncbi:MAG TPA: DUF1015 domain-containing protein, partial [Gammaproteobacteria bacterium]|nr:DUF1015 domain-containing protein [Gammaproteobacteria bacterium]